MEAMFLTNIVVECVIAVIIIVGNAVVLIALAREKVLHTGTNCLIASLAVADLLVGLGVGVYLLPQFELPNNFYGCLFVNCLIVILTGTSALNLLAVATERFIAIKFPFWYHANFTVNAAMLLGLGCWILGIILGLVPMMGWNLGWNPDGICTFVLVIDIQQHVYFTFFGTICLPLFLMLLIYISIFVEVLRSSRQIEALKVKTENEEATLTGNTVKAEIKAAKRFALVIGIFALCWMPLEIMNCIIVWYGKACLICIYMAVWLTHINSAINPFLYAYGNSLLRLAMKNTLLGRAAGGLHTAPAP